MDYSKLKVPFIGDSIIKNKAETFRAKHWNKILSIDIEKIIIKWYLTNSNNNLKKL